MEKKTGVYICSGCDIDKAADTAELEKVATKEYKVPICRTHPFLCSQEGVQLLRDDQKNEGVNCFVIAACSKRHHQNDFNMGADSIVIRAPLREQVAWILEPRDEEGNVNEDTQMAAEDYIRMYTSSVRLTSLAEPYIQEAPSKDLVVIGGGVAGMTAALEAGKAGYKVNLIEKSEQLGGFALSYKSIIPTEQPFENLMPNNISELISEVEGQSNVTVHKSSTVASIAGEPGAFQVKLENADGSEFTAGSVVMASGSNPYDASKLTDLGIANDNVISSIEFEEMAKSGAITRKDGQPAKNIVFVQCAGSRDENHLPYCSSTCCMNSLKQAAYIRELDSDAKAYIVIGI